MRQTPEELDIAAHSSAAIALDGVTQIGNTILSDAIVGGIIGHRYELGLYDLPHHDAPGSTAPLPVP